MLATLNIIVLLIWLLAELAPPVAERMAGLEAALRRGRGRRF